MNRHQRRAQAAGHLRLAHSNGTERPVPAKPPPFAWCIHELRETAPAIAIGTRVKYNGPFASMRGGTAIVVGSAQRLCRLLDMPTWKRVVLGAPPNDRFPEGVPPMDPDLLATIHDEPAYTLDHIELADGRNRATLEALAFPIWATEAWLEPVFVPRIVL